VDLGAAPGSWSSGGAKVGPLGKVIAVDLFGIAPISGVTVLKGDFRDAKLIEALAAPRRMWFFRRRAEPVGRGKRRSGRAAGAGSRAIDLCRKALKGDGVLVLRRSMARRSTKYCNV